jgi:hypothetical protein
MGILTNFTQGVRGSAPVSITAATATMVADDHAFRAIVLDRAGGIAVTLPAASGSGDTYTFYVKTTFTSSATIKVVGNDVMTGFAEILQDAADTLVAFETAADTDTITFNGTTTGGLLGTQVVLVDIAADLWAVSVIGAATGTEATPFSATV